MDMRITILACCIFVGCAPAGPAEKGATLNQESAAMTVLAHKYHYGQGVVRDLDKAMMLYRKLRNSASPRP